MSTKAQAFRAQQQREARAPRKKKVARVRRDDPVDTSQKGVSATDRKVGATGTATRNASKRAAAKGGARLENSENGKPSRKSTRRSEGRVKRTTALQQRAVRKTTAPKSRASRAQAKKK